MADYDDYIKAGLLTDDSRANAGWAALANLSSQLLNRGAMRLSPTPPPMDLAGVMKSYNDSIQGDLSRNLALHKFNRAEEEYKNKKTYEQNLRKAFDPVLRPITDTQTELDNDGEITGENTTTSYGLFESPLLQSIPPAFREIARTSGFGGFAPDILKELIKGSIGRSGKITHKEYLVPGPDGKLIRRQLTPTQVVERQRLGENPILFRKEPTQSRRYQNLGPYFYEGKIFEGTLDRQTGDRFIAGPDRKPIPDGATPLNESMTGQIYPKRAEMVKLQEDLVEDIKSFKMFEEYMGDINNAPVGLKRLSSQLTAYYKTLFQKHADENNLSPSEVALQLARGGLQGLLGRSRIEVVGGGVMTEQDARRVIEYLGGDVSALQNPQRVREAIRRIFRNKLKTFKPKLQRYQFGQNQLYKNTGFTQIEAPKIPDFVKKVLERDTSEVPTKKGKKYKMVNGKLVAVPQ